MHKNRSLLYKKKIIYRTVYIGSSFLLIVVYMIEIKNKSFLPQKTSLQIFTTIQYCISSLKATVYADRIYHKDQYEWISTHSLRDRQISNTGYYQWFPLVMTAA